MENVELIKLIARFIEVDDKINGLLHKTTYTTGYLNMSDMNVYTRMNTERDNLKRKIKDKVGLWEYLIFIFNRRYFYRKHI